jgi:hypothetical protein
MLSEEQATGCVATRCKENNGLGKLYDSKGNEINRDQAVCVFEDGGIVEVPNAGAGSYKTLLKLLGYQEVKVVDWTSSAGNWCFGARWGDDWWRVWQENRYPHFGFRYNRGQEVYDSFEDLCGPYEEEA